VATDPSATPAAAPQEIQLDESRAVANYSNFCRITATPEEAIIDFGLNMPPLAEAQPDSIQVKHRVVTNWYTAKRMLYALHMTVQRHEAFFGALELDPQRRVQQQ
jgi:hypothetical protein